MIRSSLLLYLAKALCLPFALCSFLKGKAYSLRYRLESTVHPNSRFLENAKVVNIQKCQNSIQIGANTIIGGEILVFKHGGQIDIGEWCYLGEGSRIWSAHSVKIGNRVLISHNVNIHDTNSHPRDPRERHEHFVEIFERGHPSVLPSVEASPVLIEDDVWIGMNSTVLRGVTIGKGSIVAANSIVTKDIPPQSIFINGQIRKI